MEGFLGEGDVDDEGGKADLVWCGCHLIHLVSAMRGNWSVACAVVAAVWEGMHVGRGGLHYDFLGFVLVLAIQLDALDGWHDGLLDIG